MLTQRSHGLSVFHILSFVIFVSKENCIEYCNCLLKAFLLFFLMSTKHVQNVLINYAVHQNVHQLCSAS